MKFLIGPWLAIITQLKFSEHDSENKTWSIKLLVRIGKLQGEMQVKSWVCYRSICWNACDTKQLPFILLITLSVPPDNINIHRNNNCNVSNVEQTGSSIFWGVQDASRKTLKSCKGCNYVCMCCMCRQHSQVVRALAWQTKKSQVLFPVWPLWCCGCSLELT